MMIRVRKSSFNHEVLFNASCHLSTRNLILVAMVVALTAIGGQITIPFPLVPSTLQTLVIMLAGADFG